jgi:hypothetical protein
MLPEPNLAKITENLRKDGKDETEVGKAMDIVKYKLGQLNDFRGVSVPIWAAVLTVPLAYTLIISKLRKKRGCGGCNTNPGCSSNAITVFSAGVSVSVSKQCEAFYKNRNYHTADFA